MTWGSGNLFLQNFLVQCSHVVNYGGSCNILKVRETRLRNPDRSLLDELQIASH